MCNVLSGVIREVIIFLLSYTAAMHGRQVKSVSSQQCDPVPLLVTGSIACTTVPLVTSRAALWMGHPLKEKQRKLFTDVSTVCIHTIHIHITPYSIDIQSAGT